MYSQDSEENDVFRSSFKYYKRKQPAPDCSSVIDFENQSCFAENVVQLNIVYGLLLLYSLLLILGNRKIRTRMQVNREI